MESSIETYFWMVDRLNLEDDPKNKVNMAKNSVIYSKVLVQKINNGSFVARLLNLMTPTYQQRTGKEMQLSNNLSAINENDKSFQAENWKLLFQELPKFGINVEAKK